MWGWGWAVCILFVLYRYFYTFFILYSFGTRILHFLHSVLGLQVTYSQFLVTPLPSMSLLFVIWASIVTFRFDF